MDQRETAPVDILLATYNGARFLRPQVDSLLAQDYPNLTLVIRDDGSTDGTRKILEDYAAAHPERIRLLATGVSSGSATRNFEQLLRASTAPYACCCDQDDVWLPDKVSRSMNAMHALEKRQLDGMPLLIFTDLRVVDDALAPLHASFWAHQNIDPAGIHSFRRLLTQNVVTGCTTLLNRPLIELSTSIAPEAFMHDWWIALLACGFGKADFLADPTVLYRQHDSNVVGAVEHRRPKLVPRFRYHTMRRRQWKITALQAEGLLRMHGLALPSENRKLLQAYVRCEISPNRWKRVWTVLRNRFFQKGLRPNLAILWYLWDRDADKRQQADLEPKQPSS